MADAPVYYNESTRSQKVGQYFKIEENNGVANFFYSESSSASMSEKAENSCWLEHSWRLLVE